MRMKEANWPAEQERRPRPLIKAIQVAAREGMREFKRQKHLERVRDLPDPFDFNGSTSTPKTGT
jgi:hypothetical protein